MRRWSRACNECTCHAWSRASRWANSRKWGTLQKAASPNPGRQAGIPLVPSGLPANLPPLPVDLWWNGAELSMSLPSQVKCILESLPTTTHHTSFYARTKLRNYSRTVDASTSAHAGFHSLGINPHKHAPGRTTIVFQPSKPASRRPAKPPERKKLDRRRRAPPGEERDGERRRNRP